MDLLFGIFTFILSFILVLFAIIFEFFRNDGIGILIASIGGSLLHFVGFKYAAEGDTLGMLVAVLNSNFWLATHVTTITIGYGVSLVAGLMGHIYLIYAFHFGITTRSSISVKAFLSSNLSEIEYLRLNIELLRY